MYERAFTLVGLDEIHLCHAAVASKSRSHDLGWESKETRSRQTKFLSARDDSTSSILHRVDGTRPADTDVDVLPTLHCRREPEMHERSINAGRDVL